MIVQCRRHGQVVAKDPFLNRYTSTGSCTAVGGGTSLVERKLETTSVVEERAKLRKYDMIIRLLVGHIVSMVA